MAPLVGWVLKSFVELVVVVALVVLIDVALSALSVWAKWT